MNLKRVLIQYLLFALIIFFLAIPLITLFLFDCKSELSLPPKVSSIILISFR